MDLRVINRANRNDEYDKITRSEAITPGKNEHDSSDDPLYFWFMQTSLGYSQCSTLSSFGSDCLLHHGCYSFLLCLHHQQISNMEFK